MNNIERCKELIKKEHECWIGITNQLAIKELLEKLKKKDKIIDLMADFIDENIDDCLLNILNIDEPCENYVGKNKKLCKYCIKQYFSMKVEDRQC